jgi:hypothetical protein
MPRNPRTLEAEAQTVIEELWDENLIPFALKVGKITRAQDGYTLHFYDSRIHTALVPLTKGYSFRDRVRSAVLSRVEDMSGSFNRPNKGLE